MVDLQFYLFPIIIIIIIFINFLFVIHVGFLMTSNMDDLKMISKYKNLPISAYFSKNGRTFLIS